MHRQSPRCIARHKIEVLCVRSLYWHVSCLRRDMFGNFRRQEGTRDGSSVSLKSRIQEAQREAAKRMKRYARRHTSDNGGGAAMNGLKDGVDDEMKEAMPTVEEIRVALLR